MNKNTILAEQSRAEQSRAEQSRAEQVNVIGKMDNTLDGTFESANRIYDENGLCPTIPTCGGGGIQPKILEVKKLSQQIVAMRGRETACLSPKRTEYGKEIRKAYESHEVEEQRKNMQQLEPRTDGISNTITTVQKDNLVLEKSLIVYDDYNSTIPENQDITPTLTTNCGVSALRNGTKIITVNQLVNGEIQQSETTLRIELHEKFHNFVYEIDGVLYLIRIRKLIPKCCWRLMGFTDEDFEKAQFVVSNSQLYKQAGNSIVKPVLMSIFSQLGISGVKKWNDMTEDERYSLIDQ